MACRISIKGMAKGKTISTTHAPQQFIALQRARRSRLTGKVSPDILYEDLCYDAQQTVEKVFKSVCIIHEIVFPKTHDIAYLIELLEKGGVEVPENLQNAKILTGYAVETRYPGDYEPVNEEELRKAIEIAKEVLKWAKKRYQ